MNVNEVLAAGLNLDFDYEKIKKEMLDLRPYWTYTPPYKDHIDSGLSGLVFMSESKENYEKIDYIISQGDKLPPKYIKKELQGQWIYYLREHVDNQTGTHKFAVTKNLSTEGWRWIDQYKDIVPYTIQCIESLPYKHIGCIRVFVTENTFFPTHRDFGMGGPPELSKDYAKTLGLSLIPDTGDVPMSIYSYKQKQVYEVFGNAMLFNDSAFHGVKYTPGLRITIRVFGEIDFSNFQPFIDQTQVYF